MPGIPPETAAHFPSGIMVKSIIPAPLTDTQRNGVQQRTITQKTRNGDSVLTRQVQVIVNILAPVPN